MAEADRPDDDTHAWRELGTGDTAWTKLVEQLSSHSPKTSRYRLEGEIARGGMGAIVKVWDEDLRRHLAMKVVLGRTLPGEPGGTSAVDDRTLGRFLEEAQVTGQLDHPGVVPVHELGIDDQGLVYFTMRLVRGRDLKTIFGLVRAAKEGWTQTRALGVLLKACEALAYAHSKGVVHRDLKPANMMVGRFGEVYVMDWGLARVVGRPDRKDIRLQAEGPTSAGSLKTLRRDVAEETPDSPLVTMDGDVVGTPAYMSPEQARGDVERVDARSDVYAMGAILYELLTGQMPYVPPDEKRSPRTILAAVLAGPPSKLRDLARAVPSELEAICEKAMARSAAARYRDVLELAEDLRAYLEGRVVRAHGTGAVIELRKWVRRNRALAAASAAAVLFAVAGLGGTAYVQAREAERRGVLNSELEERNEQLVVASAELESRRREAEQLLRETRAQSYGSNIRSAGMNLDAGRAVAAQRGLQACPEEYRGFEWGHLSLRAGQLLMAIEASQSSVLGVAYSPDGSRLASASSDGSVGLWDATHGDPLVTLAGHRGLARAVAFAPDATRLASAGSDGSLRLWDTASGELLLVLTADESWVSSVAFSPDGSRLASVGSSDRVRVWDATSGASLLSLAGHEGPANSVAFSPDGRRLASAGDDGSVRVWDAARGTLLMTLEGHEDWVRSVAFSPDGTRLVSSGEDGSLRTWEANTGMALAILTSHQDSVSSSAFSPDGTRLASAGDDGSVCLWDAASGFVLATLEGHEGSVSSLAFSPDGRCLASANEDGSVRLWDASTVEALAILRGHEMGVTSIDFSPDGSRLVSADEDGSVRLWDAVNGEALAKLCDQEGEVSCVVFSPDGTRLAVATEDGGVSLLDATSGSQLATLPRQFAPVASVDFSPDGARLAAATRDGGLGLWDAVSGKLLATLVQDESRDFDEVVFSPDGLRIATAGSAGAVSVWDVSTGAELVTVTGHHGVESLAFSPDGLRLATGEVDNVVRLWDAANGELLMELAWHEGIVWSVDFSRDGTRLASGGEDGVRIWDAVSGKALARMSEHAPALRVAFSPDGERLASVAGDNCVLWFSTLQSARSVWQAEANRRPLEPIVEAAFRRQVFLDEVMTVLDGDATLSGEQRQIALRMARSRGEPTAAELDKTACQVVRRPGASADDYKHALRRSEAACSREPKNAGYLNTLGAAQFRVNLFKEAIATLERSDTLNKESEDYHRILDMSYLAMAHFRAGDLDLAARYLGEARQSLTMEPDGDYLSLLVEAESLMEGKAQLPPLPRP